MMTLQHCLREARLAEEIAAQISLDTDRLRMVQIARSWRLRADMLRCGDRGSPTAQAA